MRELQWFFSIFFNFLLHEIRSPVYSLLFRQMCIWYDYLDTQEDSTKSPPAPAEVSIEPVLMPKTYVLIRKNGSYPATSVNIDWRFNERMISRKLSGLKPIWKQRNALFQQEGYLYRYHVADETYVRPTNRAGIKSKSASVIDECDRSIANIGIIGKMKCRAMPVDQELLVFRNFANGGISSVRRAKFVRSASNQRPTRKPTAMSVEREQRLQEPNFKLHISKRI